MGTELGIGEFRVKDITSLLPDWLLPAELDCDLRDNYVDGSFLDQSQELLQSDLAEMPQPCPDRCVDVGPVAQEAGQFDDGEDCLPGGFAHRQQRFAGGSQFLALLEHLV